MKNNDGTVIVNLWALVIGNSGIMKSPAQAGALAPLKKLQALAYERFNAAMAEHSEQAELEKLKKTVKKAEIKKSLLNKKGGRTWGYQSPAETG